MKITVPVLPILSLWLLSACAGAPNTHTAVTAPDISKIEARSKPEKEVKKIILAQFGETLTEYRRPQSKQRPRRPLSDIWYWTRPRAGDTRNVCKFDRVIFSFNEPYGQRENANAGVRVEGVAAEERYFLIGDVSLEEIYDLPDHQIQKYNEKCAAYSPYDVDEIDVEDEGDLIRVAIWLQRLVEASDAELADLELICNTGRKGKEPACSDVVRAAAQGKIGSIDRCRGEYAGRTYGSCLAANLTAVRGEYHDIRLTLYSLSYGAPPILVVADELIVLGEERID